MCNVTCKAYSILICKFSDCKKWEFQYQTGSFIPLQDWFRNRNICHSSTGFTEWGTVWHSGNQKRNCTKVEGDTPRWSSTSTLLCWRWREIREIHMQVHTQGTLYVPCPHCWLWKGDRHRVGRVLSVSTVVGHTLWCSIYISTLWW